MSDCKSCDGRIQSKPHWSPRPEVYTRIQQMIDATIAGSDLVSEQELDELESDLRDEINNASEEARQAERRADDAYSLADEAKYTN
jgi:hypothetical protein